MTATSAALRLEGICRSYGAIEVLQDLSLEVAAGEFVAFVGPSGCGKTTLLNLLSGHDRPTRGVVRRSGASRMIYQEGGLLPWLTARENIALGLRAVRDAAKRQRHLEDLI